MTYFEVSNGTQSVPMFSAKTASRQLAILVASEKSRSSFLADYSVITLYLSVVLVIGRLIRGFVAGSSDKVIYEEIPKPGPLLRLCSGVVIARYDDDLIREGELYLEIIEVMRSTEVLKMITKTSKDVYVFARKEGVKPNAKEEDPMLRQKSSP